MQSPCKLAAFRSPPPSQGNVRVITLNVNGIRSSERRGLARWLGRAEPWDVVCLQEIKAGHEDIPRAMKAPRRAHAAFHPAQRKGYSGVALYAKVPPRFVTGFGSAEFDAEGRYLEAHFAEVSVVSVYLPSGSSGPHRQASKFRFLAEFLPHLANLRKHKREVILCGDWNIAHKEIDLKNWRSNRKNSGFLPEERAWLTRVFDELGFVDVFRRVDPRPDRYTWWSNRGQAWTNNVGWRIDYQIATAGIAARARAAAIYTNRRFSDHAPLIVDYDYELR
jgi:exodeoxyribonuclease III